jgi:protein-disulfide isomerase
MEVENEKKRDYMLPGSILIASILISGSLIYNTGKSAGGVNLKGSVSDGVGVQQNPSAQNIRPVGDDDHILGSKNADVIVIEYSDFECPYCKRFHATMNTAVEAYGEKIAWVYRQNPIASLHSKAPLESEASECVAEIGGNNAFWAYANLIFEVSPTNNGLDLALLPDLAEQVGVDRGEFQLCLDSGRHKQSVEEDMRDASNSGARGTPYSVVINKKGDTYVIPGALPFISDDGRPSVKSIIDEALRGA